MCWWGLRGLVVVVLVVVVSVVVVSVVVVLVVVVLVLVAQQSKLRSPRPSDFARKRKIAANPPCGKRRSRGKMDTDLKTIRPEKRVRNYPNEPLTVSNSTFGDKQDNSLKDYIETSIMIRCKISY